MTEPRGERIWADQPLFRQIRPTWFKHGRPSSLNFQPLPKDAGLLSVSAGSRTTAQRSFERFTSFAGASSGVMAVTVAECSGHGLPSFYDPIPAGDRFGPDPSHALIDFRALGDRAIKRTAKLLCRSALQRGWAYCPDPRRDGAG
jgi:hypothetical protein